MGLYQDILSIATDYMGPAAQEYIDRRIRIVLRGEDPSTMPPEKIERLAAGVEMTAKFYMPEGRVESFKREILALERRYPPAPPEPLDPME